MQQRQHLKHSDYPTGSTFTNTDVHVLQHTVNIDALPEQLTGTRGTHSSLGNHGASQASDYNQQKSGSYEQNSTASASMVRPGEQHKHQRYSQQRSHELATGATVYQSSNMTHQSSTQGRVPTNSNALKRGSNLSASGVHQAPNGGGPDVSRSTTDRRGHQKPHRPGTNNLHSRVWGDIFRC